MLLGYKKAMRRLTEESKTDARRESSALSESNELIAIWELDGFLLS